MENNNREYDYSGLYHNTPNNPANQPPTASPAGQQGQPGAGGYPNVGSSGLNTANTAPQDYGVGAGGTQPQAGTPPTGAPGQTTPPQDASGYTSSFSGGGAGGNGGNGSYSYASAPQQPPKKQHKGNHKRVLTRIAAGVCVLALGVGGGFGGAVLASRVGLTGGTVVVQAVDRTATGSATAQTQGSAEGNALSVQDVSALVAPSVVVITTEQMVSSGNTWFGGSYVQSGAGSGVIMSQDGYIMTCAHVVSGATSIKVQLEGDETEYQATTVGADTTADIAILKIEATGLTPAVMGDSDTLAVGEAVVAVGNPLGTLGGTVTNGIVSALNRSIEVNNNQMNLIQTSASISPGNSGGGLFNANGELIGIVNAKSGYSEAEGLGFAIPINTAMTISKDLISTGKVSRPGLGIQVITIEDAQTAAQYGVTNLGVYVAKVNDNSGAAAAGMKAGDRIVAVGDTVVSASSDVTNVLNDKAIGDVVTIQIERDGKLMSFEVTLGERE
ncbi:MAG: trypsin-like peptidase domain-containing protein [Gemmiger sp.]|nr:trypsin-like peptidase domain-containing protein [Gemmiger sp.]